MRPFKFSSANDARNAVQTVSANQAAKFLAGGTNILDLMKEINSKEGTTFVFSTHDQRIMDHAHRVVHIQDGIIAGDELKAA